MAVKITHYDVGDVWVPQSTFTVNNAATDPTTLTVKQQNPAGTETTLANAVDPSTLNASSTPVAKTSTGVFKLNPGIQLDTAGYWFVRFTGTGAAAASEDHQAIADPSEFVSDGGIGTRALVTLAETKDWLQAQNIDTSNDLDLVRVINDVSDRMHWESGREFKVSGTNPQTRIFEAPVGGHSDPWYVDGQWMGNRDTWRRTIRVGDLTSFTQVQVLDYDWTTVVETVSLAKVSGLPLNRQPWEPITRLQLQTDVSTVNEGMRVSVTGNWGFPQVPGNVRQAVLDAVASIMDRDVEHYRQDLGNVTAGQEAGNVVVVGGGGQRLLSLPPASTAVAWSYRLLNLG